MPKSQVNTPHIHRVTAIRVYFLPMQARVPLKFGRATASSSTCARVALRVVDEQGRAAEGWGESPLGVHWSWPGSLSYEERHSAMKEFCIRLASAWMKVPPATHPLEIGHRFNEETLPTVLKEFNDRQTGDQRGQGSAPVSERPEPMPRLAALICNAPFDLAMHDAFGKLAGRSVYQTYGPEFFSADLSRFLEPAAGSAVSFHGRYPADYLDLRPRQQLRAWHLVGGVDALEPGELTGAEPKDGYPVVLTDWIQRDGLKCLKIKLRGNDAAWDYARMVKVGQLAIAGGAEWLTADYNCTVEEPAYVNEMLDRLRDEFPRIYGMILYVEQPFAYDLESHCINVHSVSARKPLFMDESAHDWRLIRLGRELGWTGVALKTCKTQTEAILSACWAKAHGMTLMVQDLTNPMLAQIPHVLLAAHAGTIMGVETNSMQFYPAASGPEEAVHPGLYRRRNGNLDLSTLSGPGFGYRLDEIQRTLPAPVAVLTSEG
jgi:L-alanine-DL-glutamate epimerase-like enolase superfamily enzyme